MELPRTAFRSYAYKPVQRLVERFSGPSVFVFACSATICAIDIAAALAGTRVRDAYFEAPNESLTAIVSLAIMLACSAAFVGTQSRRAFSAALAIKLAALCLFAGTPAAKGAGGYALLASLLAEIAIYEASFVNALICLAATAAFLGIAGAGELRASGQDPSLGALATHTLARQAPAYLMFSLVSGMFCMLIYYREKCIDQGRRVAQLDQVIARLTATNLGY
jgi:hypothetical protein